MGLIYEEKKLSENFPPFKLDFMSYSLLAGLGIHSFALAALFKKAMGAHRSCRSLLRE